MPDATYKNFGLLAIVIIWSAILFVLWRWKINRARSISLHIADARKSYILFAIVSIPVQVFFILFTIKWFVPTFQLGKVYEALLITCSLGQVLAAIVPDIPGWAHKIHWVSSYGMALIMLIATWWLAFSGYISTFDRIVVLTAAIIMSSFSLLCYLSQSARKSYLLYQGSFIALCHLAILTAVYVR